MKKVTLLFVALFTTMFASAQTTFNLDWFVGVSEVDASITIEPGDTVEWTWTDNLPHSVTSDNDATESFDSGVLTGNGETFSYTFTMVGVNGYDCEVHSAMVGTITVEEIASVEEKFAVNVNYFPNPVTNRLTVTSLFVLDTYKVVDILGKTVASQSLEGNIADIDMSQFNSGVYFVTVTSNDLQKTFKVVKK